MLHSVPDRVDYRDGDPPLVTPLPEKMLAAKRWLLWRYEGKGEKPRKVPYYANGKRRGKVDGPKDLAQMATYEAVKSLVADYDGIGFALGLDGDGYWQGIDLDSVDDNQLEAIANTLPGYVEPSPSGKGFHAIGYGQPFPAYGSNGSGTEAYCEKRYFTVTELGEGELCDLSDFVKDVIAPDHFTQETQETQGTQETHETQDIQERGEGGDHHFEFPVSARPQKSGMRHDCIFNLARHLKTQAPDTKATDHLETVKNWHAAYLEVIGTKEWMETWADFRRAWMAIRYLEGEGKLSELYQGIEMNREIPSALVELGYDDNAYRLVLLCRLLANGSNDDVFFLGCRALASVIDTSHVTANNLLRMLVDDGIIEEVEKGHLKSETDSTGKKTVTPIASTYRFIWRGGGNSLAD